ncbi:MAG TPA: hypothetical protein VKZ87_12110 [Ferrovibrio sp.]|jgi:hypothetical protein|nr:hypothetical protein [Ferrovibrio sp.]HLT78121.1 hypothetical protein [Ferrovibrio sp.]
MHEHHAHATFRLPVAVLAASLWLRIAALLPVIALLWAAIVWALGEP